MNNKGEIGFILISILISIISFFVIANFFINSSNIVVSEGDDLACRSFVQVKDTVIYGLVGEFIKDINLKCKKDYIKSEAKSKEEIFEEVANEMQRCWYRYGEGKNDFMSNFNTDGDWCFTCGKIVFKDNDKSYDYNDFVEWTKNSKNKIEIEGEKVTYADYFNLKYSDTTENIYQDLDKTIEEMSEIQEDADTAMIPILIIMDKEKEGLYDLMIKEIDTKEELYVVYRYDRLPPGFWNTFGSVMVGTVSGVVGELVVESLITGGFGAIVAVPKAIFKTLKIKKIGNKMARIAENLGKSIKFTKSKKINLILNKFDGSLSSLDDIAKGLEKIDLDYSKQFVSLTDELRKHGITHIDNIDESIFRTKEDIDNVLSRTTNVITAMNKQKTLENNLDELNSLKKMSNNLLSEINSQDTINSKNIDDLKTILKNIFRTSAAVAGGSLGYEYNGDSTQYVDILDKEQYYRLCGTEPPELTKKGLLS